MRIAIVSIIAAFCLILSFQNCSPYHQGGNGSSASESGGGIGPGGSGGASGNPLNGDIVSGAIFQTTLFPILDANCAACHGVNQVPLYMSTDPQISHDLIIINNLVDLANPNSSFIVPLIQNGHQGIPVTVGDDILQAVIAWGNQLP